MKQRRPRLGREGCEARLVEQENFEGFEERHQNLHAAPLPIRDHVHSPLEVNVEDMEQPLQPLWIGGFLGRGQQLRDLRGSQRRAVRDLRSLWRRSRTGGAHANRDVILVRSAGATGHLLAPLATQDRNQWVGVTERRLA